MNEHTQQAINVTRGTLSLDDYWRLMRDQFAHTTNHLYHTRGYRNYYTWDDILSIVHDTYLTIITTQQHKLHTHIIRNIDTYAYTIAARTLTRGITTTIASGTTNLNRRLATLKKTHTHYLTTNTPYTTQQLINHTNHTITQHRKNPHKQGALITPQDIAASHPDTQLTPTITTPDNPLPIIDLTIDLTQHTHEPDTTIITWLLHYLATTGTTPTRTDTHHYATTHNLNPTHVHTLTTHTITHLRTYLHPHPTPTHTR